MKRLDASLPHRTRQSLEKLLSKLKTYAFPDETSSLSPRSRWLCPEKPRETSCQSPSLRVEYHHTLLRLSGFTVCSDHDVKGAVASQPSHRVLTPFLARTCGRSRCCTSQNAGRKPSGVLTNNTIRNVRLAELVSTFDAMRDGCKIGLWDVFSLVGRNNGQQRRTQRVSLLVRMSDYPLNVLKHALCTCTGRLPIGKRLGNASDRPSGSIVLATRSGVRINCLSICKWSVLEPVMHCVACLHGLVG